MKEGQALWFVTHPEHGTAQVRAGDRYGAVVAAAREWGRRWTGIARDCEVVRITKGRGGKP